MNDIAPHILSSPRDAMESRKTAVYWVVLTAIAALGFILRFGTAVELPNVERPDEIYQNLEPAFRLWSGGGLVTWEWREGIRSVMFPEFLAWLMRIAHIVGGGAGSYLTLIAAVLSAVATGSVLFAWRLGWQQARWLGALICGVLCATWPDLVYLGPKALAEVQAGNLLIIAIYLTSAASKGVDGKETRFDYRMILAGILLGLVFCLRFHLSPALILVAVWTCRTDIRNRWLPLLLGALLPAVVLGLTDFVTLGSPFASVIRNFRFNIVEHGNVDFGVQPLYYYPAKLLLWWGPAVVPIAVTFLVGMRRASLLSAVVLLTILTHSLVAHKEISFIYAALPPLVIVSGLGATQIILRAVAWRGQPIRPRTIVAATALCIAFSATTALDGDFIRHWKAHANILEAEASLRHEPNLCGVGLRWPVVWPFTGGNVYLGRSVPFYAFRTPSGTARAASAINFVIGDEQVTDGLPGFKIVECWNATKADPNAPNVCLARAPDGKRCVPDPGFELNAVADLGRSSTLVGIDRP